MCYNSIMNENSSPSKFDPLANTPVSLDTSAAWQRERAANKQASPPPGTIQESGCPPRQRGGQPGNQNARKHGFYAEHMNARERRLFESASELGGTSQETILLRCKLAEMLRAAKPDVALIARLINLINRLEKDRKITDNNAGQGRAEKASKILKWMAWCPRGTEGRHCGRYEEGLRLQQQGVDIGALTGTPGDPWSPEYVNGNDST